MLRRQQLCECEVDTDEVHDIDGDQFNDGEQDNDGEPDNDGVIYTSRGQGTKIA